MKMTRVSVMVILLVMLLVPHSDAIKCYFCAGYDSRLPEDDLTNNKYCPADSFDSSKVQTQASLSGTCEALSYSLSVGDKRAEFTERYPSSYVRTTKTETTHETGELHGYICDTELCNDKNPSSGSAVSPSLLLLIFPLTALLTRSMA